MKELLLLAALGILIVWGYHLMGRLDHFLNTRVRNDDEDDTERDGK